MFIDHDTSELGQAIRDEAERTKKVTRERRALNQRAGKSYERFGMTPPENLDEHKARQAEKAANFIKQFGTNGEKKS